MTQRFYLVVSNVLAPELLQSTREFCAQLAAYTNEQVEFAVVNDARLKDVRSVLGKFSGIDALSVLEPPPPVSALPMSAAPFIWRADGRPDWEAMWNGFCELALYGGPPHRGEDSALMAPEHPPAIDGGSEIIAEIRRGIWETTGLYAEPDEPGWIAVTCHSRKMAAWMCASIIL
jgi:hypothetical protein